MGSSDLQANLEEWLRTQGYPLEMRTAQVFHQRGWFLHHSRRYKDSTLGKEREIDLIAFYDDTVKKRSHIHGHFVIECKWTPKKPWVLFTAATRTLTHIGYFRSTPMTQAADLAFESLTSESAVQSVVSAADYFAQSMGEKTKHSIVYVPTIIIDGELFRCSLNSSGDVSLQQIDMGVLIHRMAGVSSRCVHIVRESALDQFIDCAENTFQSLRKYLRD
jgi:hypothetical protein